MKRNTQIGGNHYDLPVPPIEFNLKNNLGFAEGNVIKYISRYKNKNGFEDLHKALDYIHHLMKHYYLDDYMRNIAEKETFQIFFPEIKAVKSLIAKIKESKYTYDTVVSTGRGGAWAASQLAYALNIKDMRIMPRKDISSLSLKGVLFVDDIADTGKTIKDVPFHTAVLFKKASCKIDPTYFGEELEQEGYYKFPLCQMFDSMEVKNGN